MRINLWLDDERPAPAGWMHARTVDEAIEIMEAFDVDACSLDHDLGEHTDAGIDLVLWMMDMCLWPRQKPRVHSQNPVGRRGMMNLIERYWTPRSES